MIALRRLIALLASAGLHLAAIAGVFALVTALRQPQPLFIDLTRGGPVGDTRASPAAAAPPARLPASPFPAGETRRSSVRAPRAAMPAAESAPSAAASPAPAAPSWLSASREAAPVEHEALPPAASAEGGPAPGGASGVPARPGQPAGAGGGGSLLALATPGTGRGEAPAEFGPYLSRFRERIQEVLVYPLAARRQGLSGRVEVEVLLEPSGRVRDVTVVASSAHALLDDAAVAAVRALAPQPLPEHLPRRPLRVRLPVVFELR